MAATHVYGQLESFTTDTANHCSCTTSSLNEPLGLYLDATGHLYVGDTLNKFVLFLLLKGEKL